MAGKKKDKGAGLGKLATMFTKQSEPAPEGDDVAVAANKRKQSSVLHETVFETVSGICRKNKLFVVRRDNEDLYVGLYLDLNDIGGLSAKSKDEAKGSMVSQINVGNITVMFNSELESQNGLIFIPTLDTVEHMMEYTLLRENQGYKLALIDAQGDGDFELTDVRVSLEYVHKCHSKRINIKDKLKRYLEDVDTTVDLNTYGKTPQQDEADDAVDEAVEASGEPEYMQEEPQEWQEDPELDGQDGGEPDFDGEDREEDFNDPFSDGGDEGDAYGGYEGSGEQEYGGGSDGQDDGEEVEVDYNIARQAVSRKFFNDDLVVELDTASLDQALSAYTEFRPIAMRPEGSWLSDIINPLIAAANEELFNAHNEILGDVQTEYLNQLEEAYLTQMSQLQSESVAAGLAKYQAQYDEQKAGLQEIIDKEQAAAKAAWEQKLHDAGEAARVTAIQAYKMKYQAQFEEQYKAIPMGLQAELDAAFISARGKFLTDVKAGLLRALDVQNSKLVQNAVNAYKARLPDEAALLEKHKKIIQDTLDAHREEEMSRIRVLDDEMKRNNRVAAIIEEYDKKSAAATTEFESRIAAMRADIEAQRQQFQSDLAAKNQELSEMQAKHTADQASWNNRMNELLTQIREVTDSKQREADTRVAEMRAERDSMSDKYADLQKSQKHGYTMMIAICVVACIAVFAIGMLIGTRLGGGKADSDVPEPPAVSDVTDPGGSDVAADPNVPVEPTDPGTTTTPDPVDPGTSTQPEPMTPTDPGMTGGDDLTPEEWAGMQDPVIGG